MKMVVCLALFSAPVLASSDACTGGNWKKVAGNGGGVDSDTRLTRPAKHEGPVLELTERKMPSAEQPRMNASRCDSDPSNLCDDQDVSEMPGGRVPPLCIQGKTNSRFQMWPGVLDFVIHYANKWNLTGWLKHVLSIMVRALLKPMRF